MEWKMECNIHTPNLAIKNYGAQVALVAKTSLEVLNATRLHSNIISWPGFCFMYSTTYQTGWVLVPVSQNKQNKARKLTITAWTSEPSLQGNNINNFQR